MLPLTPTSLLLFVSLIAANPTAVEPGFSQKFFAQSENTRPAYPPTVVLDQAHNAMWQDRAQPYFMPPNSTLLIKLSGFQFQIPSDLNRPEIQARYGNPGPVTQANVVRVLYQNDVFLVPWDMKDGSIRLDKSTLGKGLRGTLFNGFVDHELVFLQIG
ncbi:MAG TPA: hypothetical protein ENJ82_17375, partial [Bacteroidetes bacterium]|nr:hypothetical protein [Bacteroidota bacterium]